MFIKRLGRVEGWRGGPVDQVTHPDVHKDVRQDGRVDQVTHPDVHQDVRQGGGVDQWTR